MKENNRNFDSSQSFRVGNLDDFREESIKQLTKVFNEDTLGQFLFLGNSEEGQYYLEGNCDEEDIAMLLVVTMKLYPQFREGMRIAVAAWNRLKEKESAPGAMAEQLAKIFVDILKRRHNEQVHKPSGKSESN